MYAARFAPLPLSLLRLVTRPVPTRVLPAWLRLAHETLDQRPGTVAAVIHGVLFGRLAPAAGEREAITARALVLSRSRDPFHPAGDAEQTRPGDPRRGARADGVCRWSGDGGPSAWTWWSRGSRGSARAGRCGRVVPAGS
ncbi:hypothetical protein G5V59_26650 [Nocardioides sp. W3-2-3]|uniref:hypothetical protein n=1 Tax=Nocardioides convexus TaxID=2712224 RepID=UPI0024189D0C|nr:hypothetical protein [Nocardioides convexus]NHA01984.1 hypothetical protein [Nocardioides convexus]